MRLISRVIDEWNAARIIDRIIWVYMLVVAIYPLLSGGFGGDMLPYDISSILYPSMYVAMVVLIILNARLRKELGAKTRELLADRIAARQGINDLTDLIHDIEDYPNVDGRPLDRQKLVDIRAAVAKNGVIPRDNKALVARLNYKDMNFGSRFQEIERNLKERGLM